MRFSSIVALAIVMAAPALAVPTTLKTVERYSGETNGGYIVTFKTAAARRNWAQKLKATELNLIEGIASSLDEETLNTLRASEDVASITEDGIMHTTATQTNAPWGLGRISQAGRLSSQSTTALTYSYTYDDSAGSGVDIYIVDTGVLTTHNQFGGRARWGASFVGGTSDGNGHGTHCAGTAAGSQFGVAKRANIIAVQVLSAGGSGSTSGIVSGLDYIRQQAAASGRPSIVSMSLGGSGNTALDNAIASLTSAGIHAIVAAGNSNANASGFSPARAPSAVTVGASTIADAKASYSNFGALVDVWAPGSNVISSWIGSDTATNSISGTSMATPHVAGLAAVLISKEGNVSPAALSTKLKSYAVNGVLSGVPSGTVNNLIQRA
ncbi:serine protease [Coprinopsis sp. MPI-PUGE-AT-0042]|nr:serine protease [Coprinopsis sp. MPI-PUGE-AT-0042]